MTALRRREPVKRPAAAVFVPGSRFPEIDTLNAAAEDMLRVIDQRIGFKNQARRTCNDAELARHQMRALLTQALLMAQHAISHQEEHENGRG